VLHILEQYDIQLWTIDDIERFYSTPSFTSIYNFIRHDPRDGGRTTLYKDIDIKDVDSEGLDCKGVDVKAVDSNAVSGLTGHVGWVEYQSCRGYGCKAENVDCRCQSTVETIAETKAELTTAETELETEAEADAENKAETKVRTDAETRIETNAEAHAKEEWSRMELKVEIVPIDKLSISRNNLRWESVPDDETLNEFASNIQRIGFLNPIIVNKQYEILSGSLRREALRRAGIKEAPVIVYDTEEMAKRAGLSKDEMEIIIASSDDLYAYPLRPEERRRLVNRLRSTDRSLKDVARLLGCSEERLLKWMGIKLYQTKLGRWVKRRRGYRKEKILKELMLKYGDQL